MTMHQVETIVKLILKYVIIFYIISILFLKSSLFLFSSFIDSNLNKINDLVGVKSEFTDNKRLISIYLLSNVTNCNSLALMRDHFTSKNKKEYVEIINLIKPEKCIFSKID